MFLYSSKYECDSAKTLKADINVTWAVFAGRRDRLAFQEKYWVQLHNQGIVNVVHLWHFTSLDPLGWRKNLDFLLAKAKQYDFVFVQRPHKNPIASQLRGFYEYYQMHSGPNDVIVKVDDDIIFVNTSEFKCFVNYVHEKQDVFTVSANVVNSGVVAHIQQELGIVPLSVGRMEYPPGGLEGSLFASLDKCVNLHKYFLEHPGDFFRPEIFQYKERLSINFIAYSGRRASEIHSLVKADGNDERGITTRANTQLGLTSVVYMRLVVSHATYFKQRHIADKVKQLYNATL